MALGGARASLQTLRAMRNHTAVVDFVEKKWGGQLDCLVNNVGINVRKPIVSSTREEYDSIMRTNVDSCFFLSKRLFPLLKRQMVPRL